MKKKDMEKLADYINIALGVIGLALISWGVFKLSGNPNYFLYEWIIIGVILIIFKFILERKL